MDLQCASSLDSRFKREGLSREDVMTTAMDVRTFCLSESNFKMNTCHLMKQMACALTFTHSLLLFLAFFASEHKGIKKKLHSKDEECRKVVEKQEKKNRESKCTHERKIKKNFTTENQTIRKVRGRRGRKAEEGSAKCAKGAEEACKKRERKSCLTGSPLLLHLPTSASTLI